MSTTATLHIPHVIRGEIRVGDGAEHTSRIGERVVTPHLNLDELVTPRTEPGPAFDLPVGEIIDYLGEVGRRLDYDSNPYLAEAAEMMVAVSPHSRRLNEACYRDLARMFDPDLLRTWVEAEIGIDALDGWRPVVRPGMPVSRVRAFPPRLVHIMPGNGPGAAGMTIVRGALTKGINLLKLPSNDLVSATAILRTMADVDPDHPTLRSFSAVYWRGGDTAVEGQLLRPQYFDKIVAWGGETTIRHIVNYIGPGLQLVTYDPMSSISMIGQEAFADSETLESVVERAAEDVCIMSQDACVSSRYQFVEGSLEDIDRYCEKLAVAIQQEREWSDAQTEPPPRDISDSVEMMQFLDTHRVWGSSDGKGLVIRSEDPVDFHPIAKTVNVVPVARLEDAVHRATVATQTVGVFPSARKLALRDRLASAGVLRIVDLGQAGGLGAGEGLPHDGFYPLERLVKWVSDEDL